MGRAMSNHTPTNADTNNEDKADRASEWSFSAGAFEIPTPTPSQEAAQLDEAEMSASTRQLQQAIGLGLRPADRASSPRLYDQVKGPS